MHFRHSYCCCCQTLEIIVKSAYWKSCCCQCLYEMGKGGLNWTTYLSMVPCPGMFMNTWNRGVQRLKFVAVADRQNRRENICLFCLEMTIMFLQCYLKGYFIFVATIWFRSRFKVGFWRRIGLLVVLSVQVKMKCWSFCFIIKRCKLHHRTGVLII